MAQPLTGRTVAFLETRRSEEMARLIRQQGGTPVSAPALREVPIDDDAPIVDWLQDLVAGSFNVVIFLTGVGCSHVLSAAAKHGMLELALRALDGARVVARGPKPVKVLKDHGVRIDFVPPEPNTSEELLDELERWDLQDRTVGLQVYGGSTPPLLRLREGLTSLGAQVSEVAPYRWEKPEQATALLRLIDSCIAGEVDVLAVLSSSQIDNLFAVADSSDQGARLTEALNAPSIIVAAVGPVAAAAIESHGVRVDLQPEHPKMGHLVMALAARVASLSGGS
jgi:uroporphyrinogen-III synthase